MGECGSIPSDSIVLSLTADGGALAVAAGGRRVADLRVRLVAGARGTGGDAGRFTAVAGDVWHASAGRLRVEATAGAAGGGLVLGWAVANQGSESAELRCFEVTLDGLEAPRPSDIERRGLRLAYCGAHSRSPHSRSAVEPLRAGRATRSWWVGAVAPRLGGPGLVVGALDFRRFVTTIDLEPARLVAAQAMERWLLEPGERVELAPLWIGRSPGAPLALLEAYADEVGRRHGVRVRESPCGWGSWGHYLESIDADLMRENLIALEGSTRLREVVRVIQIDHGWSELLDSQRASASWRPNRRFASGIAPVAGEVRVRGKECGLWILPFTVNEGSPRAAAHPEYLVRDEHGRPKRVGGGRSYCVDPTHPGARAWLTDLFARIADWGVSYVKLDFLRGLLMPDPDTRDDDLETPRLYRGARTRVEAYRRGLELVREAIGPEAFLVGCSAPAGPSVGLVDAHRVGPDIEPTWVGTQSGIRDAVRSLAANWFWQGRTWVNDPDYLLATASVEESRFWVTAVALSGGSAMISADLGEIPAWQEELFAMTTPATGRAARPLDLFANGPEPRLWHLPLEPGAAQRHLVGLFNWDDSSAELSLDPAVLGLAGPVHVWDVWRRQHRLVEGRTRFYLEAHSAGLLGFRPAAGRPQLVGTDVHFAQGVGVIDAEHWNPVERTLQLQVSDRLPRPGAAYVCTPAGWRCLRGGAIWDSRPDLVRCELIRGRAVELVFDEQAY